MNDIIAGTSRILYDFPLKSFKKFIFMLIGRNFYYQTPLALKFNRNRAM